MSRRNKRAARFGDAYYGPRHEPHPWLLIAANVQHFTEQLADAFDRISRQLAGIRLRVPKREDYTIAPQGDTSE